MLVLRKNEKNFKNSEKKEKLIMSIEYGTKFGFGFILSEAEVEEIDLKIGKDSEFRDYLDIIDAYVPSKETVYFFGVDLSSIEPGMWINVSDVLDRVNINCDKYIAALIEKINGCGVPFDPRWENPDLYILSTVY
jgi:hypothetical protein